MGDDDPGILRTGLYGLSAEIEAVVHYRLTRNQRALGSRLRAAFSFLIVPELTRGIVMLASSATVFASPKGTLTGTELDPNNNSILASWPNPLHQGQKSQVAGDEPEQRGAVVENAAGIEAPGPSVDLRYKNILELVL